MSKAFDAAGAPRADRSRARRGLGGTLLAVCMLALTAGAAFLGPQADVAPEAPSQVGSLPSSRGDFNGDAKADLFWRNVSTTAVEEWLLNGLSAPTTGPVVLPPGINPPPVNWKVQGIGDFDGAGKADVLWRNQSSGASVLWTMNGFSRESVAALATESDLMWAVRGVADFDGDNKVDILWYHETLGTLGLWLGGTTWAPISPPPGQVWNFQAVGDLNGDGKSDIVWRHSLSANVVVWLMNGATRITGGFLPAPGLTQALQGVGDFNGDGRDDLLWRDELNGTVELWTTAAGGLGVSSVDTVSTLDLGWSFQRIGDYDGDGKADVLWRNSTSGNMVVWLMNGPNRTGGGSVGTRSDANWQVQGGFNWYFGSLAAPTVSPASGTLFVSQLTVSLAATTGATIRYTTDGSEPTATSPRYTAAFPVTNTVTVKARAFRQGWDDSPTTSATYTRQAATPVLSPGTGTYTNQVVVQISSETDTEVRYTASTTGTPADPTPTSSLYAGPLLVDRGTTVKARAFRSGWAWSGVASATYGIQLGAPTLSPPSGQYAWDAQITVTAPTPGTTLHYTTGGAAPTESDPTICSGCTLRNPAATLKVGAWKPGTTPSPVASATYDFIRTGRGTVLLVYGSGAGVPAHVVTRLTKLGFVVEAKAANTVVRNDAGGKALVVIASGLNLGATLKTVTTPILIWEASLYDDMGLTGTTTGVATGQTKIVVTASDHPAAGGVGGQVTVANPPGMSVSWGDPGPRARVVARAVAPGQAHDHKPVMFAYEAGDPLFDGTRAEGRRLGFLGVDPTQPASLTTPAGWALFDSAVNWLTTPVPLVLVITGATINPSDAAVIDRLIYLGYPPQIYSLGAPDMPPGPPGAPTVESSYRLVVASSTIDYSVPAYHLDGYLNLHTPMVVWEHAAYEDLAMIGHQNFQRGTVDGQHELTVLTPAHPLAAGLSGTIDPLSPLNPPYPDPPNLPPPPTTGWFSWARPPAWATQVARLTTDPDGGGLPTGIFAYDTGQNMFGGAVAPARRVGLFLTDNLAVSMNELGWKLFDAAVNWAIDRDRDTDGDGLTDLEELQYGTDPNNPDTNDDGITDGAAIHMGISATNPDMDGDGLTNGQERHQYHTDPFRADTDGDSCLDNPNHPTRPDRFPLDPALPVDRVNCSLSDPNSTPPIITLTEPLSAILVP